MTDGKLGTLGTGRLARAYSWYIGYDTTWEQMLPHVRPPAADYLEGYLRPGMRVLEWGMGASTVWLARQGVNLLSLELDGEWFNRVQQRIDREQLPNVRLLYFGPQTEQRERLRVYADYALMQDDARFDLVLVDGRCRARCLANAMRKVKVGGLVCLDDSQRGEYAAAVALYAAWPRRDWGDEGWLTTIWERPAAWEPPPERIELPVEDA